MHKLHSQIYSEYFSHGELEYEKSFVESIKNGSSEYPSILFDRIKVFSGVIAGWIPEKDDPLYSLEDSRFSKETTVLADNFSSILTERDPFYEYSFPPKGPAGIFPWIFKFLLDYAISKGLDHIIDKLKNKDLHKLGRELSIDWGKNNSDSLGQIEIAFSDGSVFIIENYPYSIERIKLNQIRNAEKVIQNRSNVNVLYDAWGRIAVREKLENGKLINIDL